MFTVAFVLAGAALLVMALVLPLVFWRRHDSASRGRAIKWLGFGIMAAFSLIASLFIAGEAFNDPAAPQPFRSSWRGWLRYLRWQRSPFSSPAGGRGRLPGSPSCWLRAASGSPSTQRHCGWWRIKPARSAR